jgi:hypothetical protein
MNDGQCRAREIVVGVTKRLMMLVLEIVRHLGGAHRRPPRASHETPPTIDEYPYFSMSIDLVYVV